MIMLAAGLIDFIFFKLFDFTLFLIIGIPFSFIAIIISFVRINGQAFHFFLLNLFQTLRKASIRVWNKMPKESDLREYLVKPPPPPPPPPPKKEFIGRSRLSELALLVNTGGVYRPAE